MQITLAENLPCARCGKDANGFPLFGCGCACVCQDHASSILPALLNPVKNSCPVNVFSNGSVSRHDVPSMTGIPLK